MAESPKNCYALSADGRSITSADDRKARIRKMIEVTQSMRYTEIVERDDDGDLDEDNPSGMEVHRHQQAGIRQLGQFSTSFVVMDSGLGQLATAARDNRQTFTAACHQEAKSYLKRVQKIEADLEESNHAAKKRLEQLEEEAANQRETARADLLSVLEVTRKKREQRDMVLKRLLEM